MITIPGSLLDGRPNQQELVLNDVVGALEICSRGPRKQVGLRLGSWLCSHSLLKPRSHHRRPPKSLDDYLQWSNLAYLAVSRVEYLC